MLDVRILLSMFSYLLGMLNAYGKMDGPTNFRTRFENWLIWIWTFSDLFVAEISCWVLFLGCVIRDSSTSFQKMTLGVGTAQNEWETGQIPKNLLLTKPPDSFLGGVQENYKDNYPRGCFFVAHFFVFCSLQNICVSLPSRSRSSPSPLSSTNTSFR